MFVVYRLIHNDVILVIIISSLKTKQNREGKILKRNAQKSLCVIFKKCDQGGKLAEKQKFHEVGGWCLPLRLSLFVSFKRSLGSLGPEELR